MSMLLLLTTQVNMWKACASNSQTSLHRRGSNALYEYFLSTGSWGPSFQQNIACLSTFPTKGQSAEQKSVQFSTDLPQRHNHCQSCSSFCGLIVCVSHISRLAKLSFLSHCSALLRNKSRTAQGGVSMTLEYCTSSHCQSRGRNDQKVFAQSEHESLCTFDLKAVFACMR